MTPFVGQIDDRIWEHARRRAHGVAVIEDHRLHTYRELTEAADRVAARLIGCGVGSDSVVGVSSARTFGGLVSLLGVLRAGGAVLYLDPEWPQQRLAHMTTTCDVSVIVADGGGIQQLPALSRTEDLTGAANERRDTAAAAPSTAIEVSGSRRLCYVVFTSGSTGTPRGVLIEHRGVFNTVTALAEQFAISVGTRVLQFASWAWDAAMCEILTTLTAGGTLVLAPDTARTGGTALAEVLRRHAVEVVTLTPSVLDAVPAADLPALHTVVSVGEACHPGVVRRWSASHRRVLNGYGPTETSIAVSVGECLPSGPIHIGTPLPNVAVRVVDDAGHDVPSGTPGELWVAGPGLARGYLGNPALTAARFRTTADGRRWYRTGDVVVANPDGTLTYIGRGDDQIKIRGHRIEPAEIERMLCTHPAVRSAAVVVAGEQLVAFVVGADPDADPATVCEAARTQAFFCLPDFLRPDHVAPLAYLPVTSNDKVDRTALAAMAIEQLTPTPTAATRPGGAPTPGLLNHVVTIAARVLKVPVAVDSNVFDLGGHSLLAAELSVTLSEAFGVDLAYQDVVQHPTPAQLAERIVGLLAGHPDPAARLSSSGGASSTRS
ncbi:non-ribosomal peptide synthetase [Dactylosporangium sp. NPDC005572]|uniref:non-ribosomal peptide synthetase n=1 Tax=Dactylosporangium sp. NPDC005572 TaxID=3156889 RepID=UPI0033AA5153